MGENRPTHSRSRAEQRATTREALLEAGVTAFAAKGHDGVNLARDILEPVGISIGSFYHQFGNKTDLLLAVIDRATTVAQERFYASIPDDQTLMGIDRVRASWDAYLSLVDQRDDVVRIQLRETHSPHAEIADAIKKLTATRLEYLSARYADLAPAGMVVDSDAMVDMSAALSLGVLTAYLQTPHAERPHRKAELVDRLTTMTLSGIPGFISSGPAPAP